MPRVYRFWLSFIEGERARERLAPNLAKINPPERFMGSKSAQNLMLMPNLLSDYVGCMLNLFILVLFWFDFGYGGRR